jgi:hypothetical protein
MGNKAVNDHSFICNFENFKACDEKVEEFFMHGYNNAYIRHFTNSSKHYPR